MIIKLKYWILIICIGLAGFSSVTAKAQCEDKLVDRAIANSGNDALFIREFVIKQREQGKKKREKAPTLSSKYDVRLNKGIVYRFIVENEENSSADAFLQLRNKSLVLASTYDSENQKNIGSFDYLCEEAGPYQVILSFIGENTGCSAGAMFAIMQDSLTLASIMDSTEIQNVLYTGMDNFIDIAASNIPDGTLDVSISRGSIEKEGGLYKIRVDEPGKLTVDVLAKDKNGKVTETFKSEFIVSTPMLPTVSLANCPGGIIKKAEILNSRLVLDIHNYRSDLKFKVKSFMVTKTFSMSGYSNDYGNRLNYKQIELIQTLSPGDTFYITNIEIEDSKGKIYHLQPIGYIIGE